MYCTNCGKFIEYNATICNECKAEKENNADTPVMHFENPGEIDKTQVPDYSKRPDFYREETPQKSDSITAYSGSGAFEDKNYYSERQRMQYETRPYVPESEIPTPEINTRGAMSVASFIMGIISYIFSVFCISPSTILLMEEDAAGVFLFFTVSTVALITLSIIFGIKSIKAFILCKKAGLPKPIKSLVFGIIGISFSAISIIVVLFDMLFGLIAAALV